MRTELKILIGAGLAFVVAVFLAGGFFFRSLAAVPRAESAAFAVRPGDGFREIASRLEAEGLIASDFSFKVIALATGAATEFKPGEYDIPPGLGIPGIVALLRQGESPEAAATIPEGVSAFQIDRILADAGVLEKGELLDYLASRPAGGPFEGRLFPDTYRFYKDSGPAEVVARMTANFDAKAKPLLDLAPEKAKENLIIASLLEREVPEPRDRRIVAGLLKKRLAEGMFLQVDATICYVKYLREGEYVPCEPILASDLKTNSPYNTYLTRGLPPGPIGNPGISAIEAALHPIATDYWYYLSDPETKKTIFSVTLDEHAQNRVKYLKP